MNLKSILAALIGIFAGSKRGKADAQKIADATQPTIDAVKPVLQTVVDAAAGQAAQKITGQVAGKAGPVAGAITAVELGQVNTRL